MHIGRLRATSTKLNFFKKKIEQILIAAKHVNYMMLVMDGLHE